MKTKKFNFGIILGLLMMPTVLLAQQPEKFKFEKVSRDVKKEAKKVEKEGWHVAPGALPIVKMLEKSYDIQLQTDNDGLPKWITATGNSVAQTQSSAQMQATEVATLRLARLIESDIRSVIESSIANNQISKDEATSFNKAIEVSVSKVAKTLNRTNPIVELYRDTDNDNVECQITISYSFELARKAILEQAKLELQQESEGLMEKYDAFLNPEFYNQGTIHNATN